MTTVRRRTTSKKERGIWGHEQVISNIDRGEHRKRGDDQEESDTASRGWSGKNTEDSEGLETEEEAMTAGGTEWERETRTSTAWGTQEIGERDLPGEAMASRSNTGKYPSTAAEEAGVPVFHGARLAQRGLFWCSPCRPSHPHVSLPRRYLA